MKNCKEPNNGGVLDVLNDWQSFGTDRCIIEVWAELEPAS